MTDRLGNASVYTYNLRGDVVSQTTVDPANPEGPGLTTTYVVDKRGNVLQVT